MTFIEIFFTSLIITTIIIGILMLTEMFVSRIIDAYFKAKLKYTGKLLDGIGKFLTDAAKQMGGTEKD